jgi:hypothetical protein
MTGNPEVILRTSWKVAFSVTSPAPRGGPPGKFPKILTFAGRRYRQDLSLPICSADETDYLRVAGDTG